MGTAFTRGSAAAFTLIELLVCLAIIALLIVLLLPSLGRARDATRMTICGSNARQMALALQMYCEDNGEWIFPYKQTLIGQGELWWFGFEAYGGPTAEGSRVLDRTRGRLWRYYTVTDSIEVCPSFPLMSAKYKPKYATNWTTYGLPLKLMSPNTPVRTGQITSPGKTLAFADCAQINIFQAPASPSNPLFEQWYYFSNFEQTMLYLHQGRATASLFDGHVAMLAPEFGVDARFPEAPVGRPPSSVLLQTP